MEFATNILCLLTTKMTKGLREGRCARSLLATVSYAHLVKGGVELQSQKTWVQVWR